MFEVVSAAIKGIKNAVFPEEENPESRDMSGDSNDISKGWVSVTCGLNTLPVTVPRKVKNRCPVCESIITDEHFCPNYCFEEEDWSSDEDQSCFLDYLYQLDPDDRAKICQKISQNLESAFDDFKKRL